MNPVAVAFVRALGAAHAGVGVCRLVPADCHPLAVSAAAGAAAFLAGRSLGRRRTAKEVFAYGYLAPLAGVAAAMLLVRAPASWPAASGLLRGFLAGIALTTPKSVYLGCLAYACLAARPAPAPTFYR